MDSERDKKSSAARAGSEAANKRAGNKGAEKGIPEENPDDGSIKTIEREDSNNRLYTDDMQSPIDANFVVRSSVRTKEMKKKQKVNKALSSESCEQSNPNLRKEVLDPKLQNIDEESPQKKRNSTKKLTKRSEDVNSNASFEESMRNRYPNSSQKDQTLKVHKRQAEEKQ